jgi:DNA-binding beta-propeller fold protein YncE
VDREEFTSFYAASFPRLVGQLYALEIAITPNGKTAYITGPGAVVVPVSTATNQPGQPIRVPYGMPGGAVITP